MLFRSRVARGGAAFSPVWLDLLLQLSEAEAHQCTSCYCLHAGEELVVCPWQESIGRYFLLLALSLTSHFYSWVTCKNSLLSIFKYRNNYNLLDRKSFEFSSFTYQSIRHTHSLLLSSNKTFHDKTSSISYINLNPT